MKGRRRYLYGSLGLLSLLGFVGVLTQERVFLLFFAFAVDFGHWFGKAGAGHARFNVATSRENIEEAAGRIIAALSGLNG